MSLHPFYQNFLDRVNSQTSGFDSLENIPKWLEVNTKDPRDNQKLWSFEDHEYQIDILKDPSDEGCIQKCSQVGASELSVRLMLALLALMRSVTGIYVLPTTGFARKFAKQRVDSVISNSKALSEVVNKDVDSSELKQLGQSFLYIAGSFGQSSAISIPAAILFKDEVDFCNQETLTTYNSRLGHNKPGEYFNRSFSTPTVLNFGINKLFEKSSQAYYTVKCRTCYDWVAPSFFENVRIPGYDDSLLNFEKEDLWLPSVDVSKATLHCPSCNGVIPHTDLCDPSKRQWVRKYPDRSISGYQISPYDVPGINPIARTIQQIEEYEYKKDWANFKVGVPFEDAENSFVKESIKKMSVRDGFSYPDEADERRLQTGSVFGLDVGKISHFTLLTPIHGKPVITYAERIRQDGDNYLGKRVLHLCRVFGVVRGVVDAGPDISVSKYLVDNAVHGLIWACYYARTAKNKLESLSFDEAEQVVSAFRTGTFDQLVRKVNGGHLRYGEFAEKELHLEHLSVLKRVSTKNDAGDELVSWVSTGDDHYGHSLNYANMAWNMREDLFSNPSVIPCGPGIGKAKMKELETPMEIKSYKV